MRTTTTGNYAGVGLSISKLRDPKDKELPYVYVMNAFEGYAYDAGVRVGDKILTVDGKDLRDTTVTGAMSLFECVYVCI
jgi:C-terminal processing protease CtpA/Prc